MPTIISIGDGVAFQALSNATDAKSSANTALSQALTALTKSSSALSIANSASTSAASTATSIKSHTDNKNNPHSVTAAQAGAVPTSRTVNGKALSSNITLSAGDVGAATSSALSSHTSNTSNPHSVTAAQAGAVPTSRKVNGKALSSDITLSAGDVGVDLSQYFKAAGLNVDPDGTTPGIFAYGGGNTISWLPNSGGDYGMLLYFKNSQLSAHNSTGYKAQIFIPGTKSYIASRFAPENGVFTAWRFYTPNLQGSSVPSSLLPGQIFVKTS